VLGEAESEGGATTLDRREEAAFVGGGKKEMCPGRRLLEQLQERVLGRLRHPIGAGDEGDPSPPLDGEEGDRTCKLADRVDPDLVAGPGRGEKVEIGVALMGDEPAGTALVTGGHVGRASAEERHRHLTGEPSDPDAGRADQKEGMGWRGDEQGVEMD
jgi:hypothetical protein